MSRQVAASHFQKSKTLNDKYLLGEELGKGAHGRVYKGVDLQNGDFVAIKQVSLENISPGDLSNIMSEIDLLKNLNHKNIVKYLGSYKTKSHLYIFLEFVENGSLASIIKPTKFGAFPESLVAIYITQVLEGLVYLHEQGVIHRDIKGANILTTKEGLVKLADFGVATKLTEADENAPDVVGTPYWMAPEVILMSGVSAASDIWSVGCTVIELLTCVPPYFNLQPMSALFRIVQNGTPPLPDDLSTDLTDFLLQCFHKDAKQRPDAASLLRHPWIRNSRRAIRSSLVRSSGRISYVPEDVSTVVERTIGDAELNGSPEIIRPSVEKAVTPELTRSSTHDGSMERSASANEVRALETSGDKGATLSQTQTPRFMQPVVNGAVIPSHRRANSDDAAPRPPRSQTNSFTSQQHSERGAVVGARSSPDLSRNSTLEGGSNGISWTSNGSKYRATSSAERPVPNGGKLEAVVVDKRMGDYGGAVSSRQGIEEFPGETGPTPRKKNQVFVEKQVKGTRSMNVPGRKSSRKHSMDYADAVLADIVDAAPVEEPPGNREVPPRPLGSFGSNGRATRGRLERAVSLDGGASSQVLDAAIAESQAMMGVDAPFMGRDSRGRQSTELVRLLLELRVQRSDEDVLQACHQLSEHLRAEPEQKEQLLLQHGTTALTEMLEGENSNQKVLVAVLMLINQIMVGNVEMQEKLCLLGLIPTVLGFASAERSRLDLRLQVAQFAHQICQNSPLTLQMLISCRGLPVLVGFLEPDFVKYRELVYMAIDCIVRVLDFQGPTMRNDFCRTFAKSGILLRLVNVMHSMAAWRHEQEHGSLTPPNRWRHWPEMAMDSDFDASNGPHPTGSNSHLPLRGGLEMRENGSMEGHSSRGSGGRGSAAGRRLIRSKSGNCTVASTSSSSSAGLERNSRPNSMSSSRRASGNPNEENLYLSMAAGVLVEMARGDDYVKDQFCSQSILRRLLDLLDHLDAAVLVKVLRCIRQLSSDPHCLEPLQRAEAIENLVPFLERHGGQHLAEIHKQVLSSLYNLCKVNKRRQELAAEAGIVSHLVQIITSESSLNQFALPLLCDMAHATRITREQLRMHGAIELYLVLLKDSFWAPTALDSLAVCLAHDSEQRRVEQLLLRRDSLDRLVAYFQSCSGPTFVHILEPFLKMMTKSVRLNAALAVSGLTPLLVARLEHQDAIARLNLLKMIKAVYEHHPRPKQLLAEHDLPRKLQRLTEDRRDGERSGGQVLVKQMATTLLKGLHVQTRPGGDSVSTLCFSYLNL